VLGPDGKKREVYLYQICDNTVTMKEYGVQAVVWQTAIPALIAMELVSTGMLPVFSALFCSHSQAFGKVLAFAELNILIQILFWR
jgi:hypothetical protein